MKTFLRLFILAACLLVSRPVFAWSGPGHMIVAAIAYRDLSPAERKQVDALLRGHPWSDGWIHAAPAGVSGLTPGLYAAMAASLWPDQIRRHGDPTTHGAWHFVDYALIPPAFAMKESPTPNDDILFGMAANKSTLAKTGSSAQEKAEALCWLIHLTGDIHQPLHCAALINDDFAEPAGDRGGNGVHIRPPNERASVTLHHYWDAQFGHATKADTETATAAHDLAQSLAKAHPRPTLEELRTHRTVKSWSLESRAIAIEAAYLKGKLPYGLTASSAKTLTEDYAKNAHEISERRIVLAGYRLADEIRKLLK